MQGKNVLYFDNIKLKYHPFINKNFTISNEAELNKKIDNYFGKKETFQLKSHEKIYLNEFCDTKTNIRAAFVFETVFDLLKKDFKKDYILNFLKKKYQLKYNKKKIVAKKGKLRTINIWEKELRKIENTFKKYK